MDKMDKIDEIKENINQDSNETKSENNEIFNYLVDHPSILITAVSAIVAIFSFVINFLSYMRETQELCLWNVDPTLISIKNQQLFYSICFSLIYSIISILSMSLISNTYMAYKPFLEYVVHVKAELSRLKKKAKTDKRTLKSEERRFRKLPECDNKETLRKENIEEKDLCKKIDLSLKNIKKIRRSLNKIKYSFIMMLYANLLIALILTFISSVIVICPTNIRLTPINSIIVIIVLTTIQFFMYCFMGYLGIRLSIRKKKNFAQSEDKTIDYYSDNIFKAEYPIVKIKKQGLKSFFTNSTFYSIILGMIVLIVMNLLPLTTPQNSNIIKQKQCKVLLIGETQYAVIYTNSEKMILEEITITNGSGTIYTTKQRIVPVDAYPFEVITFKNIFRK